MGRRLATWIAFQIAAVDRHRLQVDAFRVARTAELSQRGTAVNDGDKADELLVFGSGAFATIEAGLVPGRQSGARQAGRQLLNSGGNQRTMFRRAKGY
jgi:hypothetical protein